MRILLSILLPALLSCSLMAAPLRAPANSRYFINDQGKAVYLSGWHTWNNFQDFSALPNMDYAAYLNTLEAEGSNFIRLWNWESLRMTFFDCPPGGWGMISPLPFARTGPGLAIDGKPKCDLTQYNPEFFDRLRERVALASQRGIYVMVMLFEAIEPITDRNFDWSPYNAANNVNGGVTKASDVFTLNHPGMTQIYNAYIRKVVDTLNDFDNVLFEPANEPQPYSAPFISHVIDTIHQYEAASKPKRHPVIYSSFYSDANHFIHAADNADWIAPGATKSNWDPVLYANPKKPWLMDSDHIFYPSTDGWPYAWKCFLRGYNYIHMDTGPVRCPSLGWALAPDPRVRRACGDTVRFANRMDLIKMAPSTTISSTAYALFQAGQEYLVWQPAGASSFTVRLEAGSYDYEWFAPATSTHLSRGLVTVSSGDSVFNPPTGYAEGIVLYLKRNTSVPDPGNQNPPPPNPGSGSGSPLPQLVSNFGFEGGTDGWIISGNLGAPLIPDRASEGGRMIAFNWGQTVPNGILSQPLATKPGHRYTLRFDVGAVGWNNHEQRLLVSVHGGDTLLSDTVTLSAKGNGVAHWVSQTFAFTADSASTTVEFKDISLVTLDLDLLLDHVRVTEDESGAPTPEAPAFANGSFETGTDGWTLSGYVRSVRTTPRLPSLIGGHLVVFNAGDTPPNGVIAQTFATQVGRTYALNFSAGLIAYTTGEQRMQIDLHGTSPLLSKEVTLSSAGYASIRWLPQDYAFVADGPATTLTFRDVSTITHSLDLLLDNVKVSLID